MDVQYKCLDIFSRIYHQNNIIIEFQNNKSNQLICLSNMENLNAVFIKEGFSQIERLEKLNKIAVEQMKILENIGDRKLLR